MKQTNITTQLAIMVAVIFGFNTTHAASPFDASRRGYLLVPDYDKHNLLRFDAATGAFVDEFVSRKSGGLNQPYIALIGPHDGHLYVTTGHFDGPGQIKSVLRYDGTTGAFLDEFVQRGQMDMAHAVMFGPDGHVYVGVIDEGNTGHRQGGRIARFNGITGAFMGDFVPLLSGGLRHPLAHVFGPNGNGKLDLYVTDEEGHDIKRYDGTTGAFLGVFAAADSGVIQYPFGLVFGPDGNLYVADFGIGGILRFADPSSGTPGAPMPSAGNSGAVFVAPGSGGLLNPLGVIFGPDGNGDGHQDLYVSSTRFSGFRHSRNSTVLRYDGVTGAFIDTFVPVGSGGLDGINLITFTETDPVTLKYLGD